MNREKIVIVPETVADEVYLEQVLGVGTTGTKILRTLQDKTKNVWGQLELMKSEPAPE